MNAASCPENRDKEIKWTGLNQALFTTGEQIGRGSVEATYCQTQCRFKRPGQFWSQCGDEALMSLEMF
jgi:hypothetical protein